MNCAACGEHIDHDDHGVPMLEGMLVSNEWRGPWGGQPACRDCFEAHASGRMRTFDLELAHYLPENATIGLLPAAKKLLALIDAVGTPDGDESDRVFARYEFDELRKAVAASEMRGVGRLKRGKAEGGAA